MMAAIRRVLKECYRHGLMSRADLERAIDLEPIRGRGIPPGRALDTREVETLMSAAGEGSVAARNRAILAMLYGCRLRSVEITRLLFRDLDQEEREVVVRGKGSKDRRVPIPDGAGVYLDNWIDYRGRRHGPLFCTARSIRRIMLQPISPDAVYRVVVVLVEAAGIERAPPTTTFDEPSSRNSSSGRDRTGQSVQRIPFPWLTARGGPFCGRSSRGNAEQRCSERRSILFY